MDIKNGWKTTEFWLTLLANVVGVLLMTNVIPTESPWIKVATVVSMVLANLGYTYSRGLVKAGGDNTYVAGDVVTPKGPGGISTPVWLLLACLAGGMLLGSAGCTTLADVKGGTTQIKFLTNPDSGDDEATFTHNGDVAQIKGVTVHLNKDRYARIGSMQTDDTALTNAQGQGYVAYEQANKEVMMGLMNMVLAAMGKGQLAQGASQATPYVPTTVPSPFAVPAPLPGALPSTLTPVPPATQPSAAVQQHLAQIDLQAAAAMADLKAQKAKMDLILSQLADLAAAMNKASPPTPAPATQPAGK
jgi:hypothetical protein